ncbi:MAG: DUF4336 domain-containing protein [Pseudomonadota bacterium]
MEIVHEFAPDLWVVDGDPLRMFTIPFTTRMTVVRLRGDDLWLHSPVAPTRERVNALRGLGRVRHLVAPNKIHSLGIAPWLEHNPDARVWVSPQFLQRHSVPGEVTTLGDLAPAAWNGEIAQLPFRGSSVLDEMVFLHRSSRTLILTDLIQKHDPGLQSGFWRIVKRLNAVLGDEGGTARDLRATFFDRAAARESLVEMMNWDFDNLIISHGKCLRGSAKAEVKRAFEWL